MDDTCCTAQQWHVCASKWPVTLPQRQVQTTSEVQEYQCSSSLLEVKAP